MTKALPIPTLKLWELSGRRGNKPKHPTPTLFSTIQAFSYSSSCSVTLTQADLQASDCQMAPGEGKCRCLKIATLFFCHRSCTIIKYICGKAGTWIQFTLSAQSNLFLPWRGVKLGKECSHPMRLFPSL